MNLIDTHTHLYWESFKEDFDEVIKRALDAGVGTIINVGVDVEKSKEALKQVQETNWPSGIRVYSTIGIHPHEASNFSSDQIDKLEKIYRSAPEKVVGVGECGLDYSSTSEESKPTSEVFIQKKLFQTQIDLAKKLNLPLLVHCRDDRSKDPNNSEAWDSALEMVGSRPSILHCYSGLLQTTNQILKTPNLIVSFAGNLTYPQNEYLRESAKVIPLDRIVLETDCPFLPPQSKRGQRNEPGNVLEVAQTIAEIKGISLEEVANQTTENVRQILRLRSG